MTDESWIGVSQSSGPGPEGAAVETWRAASVEGSFSSQASKRPVVWSVARRSGPAAAIALVICLSWSVTSRANPLAGLVKKIFHPPEVEMREAYPPRPDGPSVDHSIYDALLADHVREGGWVDYRGLERDRSRLDAYREVLAAAPFDELGRNEKLALLMNAYNAFTLELILDHGRPASIRDIPAGERWEAVRWQIGPHTWSLDQIEHRQIRPKFVEPRIHFALVCAAVGCPPLRREAYQADRVNEQLADQTKFVHAHESWLEMLKSQDRIRLTRYYDWYDDDFAQVAGSVLEYAARHSPALRDRLSEPGRPEIEWIEYDWALNGIENRRPR